jgi:RND family efflux transporter MFP subunit
MPTQFDLRQLAVDRREAAPSARRSRRHVLTRVVIPAVLTAGFAVVLGLALRDVVLPAQEVTLAPVLMSRAAVQKAGTPLFKAAGWIEPRPTPIHVAALTSGVVERLVVVEDQEVRRGEPVAYLVAEDARLARDAAAAMVNLRQADLDQTKATHAAAETAFQFPVALQAALAEADAQLATIQTQLTALPFERKRAEARLSVALQDYEGKSKAQGVVSGLALQQSRAELESARAVVEEVERRETSLSNEQKAWQARREAVAEQLRLKIDETRNLQEGKARVDAAAAMLQQAKVALREAQLRLDRMVVRAPVDGRVLRLLAHTGTAVSTDWGEGPDAGAVISMYDPKQLQVRVDVRFDDLPRVVVGQPVEIRSPACAHTVMGHVLYISSLADIQKNTLQVKVALEAAPEIFKPDMLIDATFLAPQQAESESGSKENWRLFVPRQLVTRGEEGSYVWVADLAQRQARRQKITLGSPGTDDLVEVVSGLTSASRLIVQGRESLKEGARIRVIGEDTSLGLAAHQDGVATPLLRRHPASHPGDQK